MATHPNDETGGAAVDDLLSRLRLKRRPASIRPLQSRIDGTTRWLLLQRAGFAAFAAAWLVATLQIT